MQIEKITGKSVNDFYYKIMHPTGLRIFIYPKPTCSTNYAIFGTKYGSINNAFKRTDSESPDFVPEGIAHFLEHKLFENEDGIDTFERFAKTGASANAFTSFDSTCYLFSCTDSFYDSLEILLDFVQSPYFSAETVLKEQGIIGQEIRMYDDNPQWQVMFNCLRGLYHSHPVKIDIAGTVASIADITPEHLYRCHETFYHPQNMALCIAGNVDYEKILEICDRRIQQKENFDVDRIFESEPNTVVEHYVEKKLPVSIPLFQFAIKETIKTPKKRTEKDIAAASVLLHVLASSSSPLFRRMLDQGLVNDSSFGFEYFEGGNYGALIFGGESIEPRKVAEEIQEAFSKLKTEGVLVEDFERAKKSAYGSLIYSLNSTTSIANSLVSLTLADLDFFSYIDAFMALKLSDVTEAMELFDLENHVLSVVSPL